MSLKASMGGERSAGLIMSCLLILTFRKVQCIEETVYVLSVRCQMLYCETAFKQQAHLTSHGL